VSARVSLARLWHTHAIGLIGAATLVGCTSLGGNVKGSFSCAAPDGICAPSSSIDDRALALISGEPVTISAGPYRHIAPRARSLRIAVGPVAAPADTGRTEERVLRIVFQPYIDDRGRLHEASVVHAVVEAGQWRQEAVVTATAIPPRGVASASRASETLAEAVDRADPPSALVSSTDPNLPDPAAVASARARKTDPVAAIRAVVAARLGPKASRTPVRGAEQRDPATQAVAAEGTLAPRPASAPPQSQALQSSAIGSSANAAAPRSSGQGMSATQPSTAAEAQARVKADARYRARAAEIKPSARQHGGATVRPGTDPVVKQTVQAAAFPTAVTEDK
jgi:conjugal transfer pilus assembly protein TraV